MNKYVLFLLIIVCVQFSSAQERFPNDPVTQDMLEYYDDFLVNLISGFETDEYIIPEISEIEDRLFEEHVKNDIESISREFKKIYYGYSSGKIITAASVKMFLDMKEDFSSSKVIQCEAELTYDNYAIDHDMFLSGQISAKIDQDTYWLDKRQYYEITGKINFSGYHSGSIVFDNIKINVEVKHHESSIEKISGELYLLSAGKQLLFPERFADYPDQPADLITNVIPLLPIYFLSEEFDIPLP